MKKMMWFAFHPTKETVLPLVLGVLAIVFSMLMNCTQIWGWRFFFRSICQMSIVGVIVPIFIMDMKGELGEAGIKFEKPVRMLLISTVLGALLSFVFIKEANGHVNNIFGPDYIQSTVYVMIANIFEVIFFFCFMRYYFEKAFGVIAAILITAFFYSFHHAGFEPNFVELFIVGVVFISIFRVANNILICFPLWWVGGLGDVIVSKQIADDKRMSILGIAPVVVSLVFMLIYVYFKKRKKQ